MLRLTVVLTLVATLFPAAASAHPVPFSYLDLKLGRNGIDGTLVVHIIDAAHDLGIDPPHRLLDPTFAAQRFDALVKLLAARLRIDVNGRAAAITWTRIDVAAERQSVRLVMQIPVAEAPASVHVNAVLFPYDGNHRTFLNIYEGDALAQAILDRGKPSFEYFAGTRQGAMAVVRKFLPSGVHHILIGPDHLLFLIGLLLLGGPLRRLILIVTAFTLAHSVTLALAALDIVVLPDRLVEAVIALSIAFVAAENIFLKPVVSRRWLVSFCFGLVHGFGFSSALRELNLPTHGLVLALFGFNVGVELGQGLVVALALPLMALIRRVGWGQRMVWSSSVAILVVGVVLFVERAFF